MNLIKRIGRSLIVYSYIAKLQVLVNLAYRFEVYVSLGSNMVLMFATVFLWKTAYRGIDAVSNVNKEQMITYAVVSALLNSFFSYNVQYILRSRIREGNIARDFLKPVNPIGFWLFEDIGRALSALGNQLLPLLVIAILTVKILLPQTPLCFFLFIISSTFSFIILWLISLLVGLGNFWFVDFGNMGVLKDAVVRVLSGSLVPIWFFPGWIQKVSVFLPFQYIYQTPLGIYINKFSSVQAIGQIAAQGVWVIILSGILYFVWYQAKKHILIQGG